MVMHREQQYPQANLVSMSQNTNNTIKYKSQR